MKYENMCHALEVLNIHELRSLGRMWGIINATTMPKEELSDKILLGMCKHELQKNKSVVEDYAVYDTRIFNSLSESVLKNISDNLISSIEGIRQLEAERQKAQILQFPTSNEENNFDDEDDSKPVFVDIEDIENFNSYGKVAYFYSSEVDDEPYDKSLVYLEGILYFKNREFFIESRQGKVVVPLTIVVEHSLSVGDYVNLVTKWNNEKNIYDVQYVQSINLLNLERRREIKHDSDVCPVSVDEPSSIGEFKEGENNIFYLENSLDIYDYHKEDFINLLKNGYIINILATNFSQEDKECIEFKNFSIQFINYGEAPSITVRKTKDFIANSLRIAQEGRKVCCLIIDIQDVVKDIENYYYFREGPVLNAVCISTLVLIEKLFGMSSKFSNGGMITTIITASPEYEEFDDEDNV